MRTLFITDEDAPLEPEIPGAEVLSARRYLTGSGNDVACGRVINLCRCDRAKGSGYYVSLLAEARGHSPIPSAKTLEDLRDPRAARPELATVEELAQRVLRASRRPEFELYSYFGADPDGAQDALAQQLHAAIPAPLLRASLRREAGRWRIVRVRSVGLAEVPAAHRPALLRAAAQFATGQPPANGASRGRPAVAILHDPDEPLPPSNPEALQRFLAAARALGMRAEIIGRGAMRRLQEFDALFIRDTTQLEHYTWQFAQRAASLGLVVIDDPDSILQCNNKVYLHELLTRHGIPTPRTMPVHRDNIGAVVPALGLPCILKQPDGGFSLGVRKASDEAELRRHAAEMLSESELIIAQEYLPTEFDWRVTVLEGRPLFVCKYFMAPGHWQVHKYERDRHLEGRTSAISIGEAPSAVVSTALRAANLIGNGLYGVDLKQIGEQCVVIEINDNPNIDAGNEDTVLRDALYREVMGVLLRRITERQPAMAA